MLWNKYILERMQTMKLLFILHNFLDPSVSSVLCANILLSTQFSNTVSVLPLRAIPATTHSSHNASNEVTSCTNDKELCDVHLTAEGLINTQIKRGISVAGKIFLEFKCMALMSVPTNDLCYFRIFSLSKSGVYIKVSRTTEHWVTEICFVCLLERKPKMESRHSHYQGLRNSKGLLRPHYFRVKVFFA